MNEPVLIDRREPAYTVYLRIPIDKLESLRPQFEAQPQVQLVEWASFVAQTDLYIKAVIVKNEYPDQNVPTALPILLEKFIGAPIGVAWNGGITFTFKDYQHATRRLEQYTADPVSYEVNRPKDAATDPIHPAGHINGLLAS